MGAVASEGRNSLVNLKVFRRLAEINGSHGNIKTFLMIIDQCTFSTLPFSNHYYREVISY